MRFSGFSFRLGKNTRLYFSNSKSKTKASAPAPAPAQQDDGEPRVTIGGVAWRLLLLFMTCNGVSSAYWRGDILPFIGTIVLMLGAVALLLWYFFSTRRAHDEWEASRAARIAEAQQAQAQAAAEDAAKAAERQARLDALAEIRREYARTHDSISTKVAGVTFKNPDGSSRQAYLKDLDVSGANNVQLVQFDYQGSPALRVVVDGMEIGNIPADIVPDVLDVMPRIDNINCTVSSFDNDSGRRIYRADLDIWYQLDD